MPIYAYKCGTCGFAKDVLQKMSDTPLTECPACGASAFAKQLTAAGFQLKGSGWYVTDFRDGAAGKKGAEKSADKGADGPTPSADGAAGKAADSPATATAPAVAAPPAPAAATPAATKSD